MTVSRQDAETTVPELADKNCERLLGVPGKVPGSILVLYLLAEQIWYRIFVDAGVLFLDEVSGPDAAEDLIPGESYVDLLAGRLPAGDVIKEIKMAGGVLTMRFLSTTLTFHEANGLVWNSE